MKNDRDDIPNGDGCVGVEVAEIMENHDLDKDEAERVQDVMEDLGVDEDDAVEIAGLM